MCRGSACNDLSHGASCPWREAACNVAQPIGPVTTCRVIHIVGIVSIVGIIAIAMILLSTLSIGFTCVVAVVSIAANVTTIAEAVGSDVTNVLSNAMRDYPRFPPLLCRGRPAQRLRGIAALGRTER